MHSSKYVVHSPNFASVAMLGVCIRRGRTSKVRLKIVPWRVSEPLLTGLASTKGSNSHNVAFSGRGPRYWQPAVNEFRVEPWIGVHPRDNSAPLWAKWSVIRVLCTFSRCEVIHINGVFQRRPTTRVRRRR